MAPVFERPESYVSGLNGRDFDFIAEKRKSYRQSYLLEFFANRIWEDGESFSITEPSEWNSSSHFSASTIVPVETTGTPCQRSTTERWRPWLVVAGGFITYFTTFGLIGSFGTFFTYYMDDIRISESASTVTWIGTLQLFLLYIGGLFLGPAFDRFGSRAIFVPGTVIYVTSLMLTSICSKLWQFVLAQGILFGIGDAMLFFPPMACISQWSTDARRGLMLGLAASGSAVGGVVWPIAVKALFGKIGFGWTVRLCGFVSLCLLIPCSLLLKEKRSMDSGAAIVDSKAEPSKMFKSTTYIVLTVACFFVFWGMYVPFYFLPVYGQTHGLKPIEANDLLALLQAGSFVGRILTGAAADKFGKFNITFGITLGAGVLLVCLDAIKTRPSIRAFVVLYGFLTGGLNSMPTACIAQITPNPAVIGKRIGFFMAFCSLAVLSGAPIAGKLLGEEAPNWSRAINFCGIAMLVGAVLLLCSRLTAERRLFRVC